MDTQSRRIIFSHYIGNKRPKAISDRDARIIEYDDTLRLIEESVNGYLGNIMGISSIRLFYIGLDFPGPMCFKTLVYPCFDKKDKRITVNTLEYAVERGIQTINHVPKGDIPGLAFLFEGCNTFKTLNVEGYYPVSIILRDMKPSAKFIDNLNDLNLQEVTLSKIEGEGLRKIKCSKVHVRTAKELVYVNKKCVTDLTIDKLNQEDLIINELDEEDKDILNKTIKPVKRLKIITLNVDIFSGKYNFPSLEELHICELGKYITDIYINPYSMPCVKRIKLYDGVTLRGNYSAKEFISLTSLSLCTSHPFTVDKKLERLSISCSLIPVYHTIIDNLTVKVLPNYIKYRRGTVYVAINW